MAGDASAELLVQALEAVDVSVCIADARLDDMPVVWVNDAFESMTGYASADVLGRNCRFLQGSVPAQPQLDEVRKALSTGVPVSVIVLNERSDGTRFHNQIALSPLHDDAGGLTHFLALQRDVTADVADQEAAAEGRAAGEVMAQALQRSLAPPRLPDVPGLDVAVRYEAATTREDGTAVSGDFYDVYATADAVGAAATWNAAIGDVAGRGPEAAAYTATVRHLLKGIALRGSTPSESLALLNAALLDELGDRFVTVALAQLQVRRESVRATVALGGHPRPVLVRDGEAHLVGEPGDLIGAFEGARSVDARVRLEPGDALLMYTDGVTEAGPADDQFGEDRLLETAAAATGDAGTLVDAILGAVHQHAPGVEDDSALLALRVERGG